MDFQYDTINGAPVAWSDNFILEEEIDSIYDECNKIRKLGLLTDQTGGAINADKSLMKSNKGVFFEELYKNYYLSETLKIYLEKIHQESFRKKMEQVHPYFRTLQMSRNTCTLLSYYEASDYYKGHIDTSFITVLFWFYKDPKVFSGGDLIIENELTIECKRGRILFMPGWLTHEVTPVSMSKENQGKGLGRYSISQFIIES
jgi:hypothetical protein|tara:strand:+ start:45 stop:650 length:606 start_codon:yes stop_codon:yes gene_type:complete